MDAGETIAHPDDRQSFSQAALETAIFP